MVTRWLLPLLSVVFLGFAMYQMSLAQQKDPPTAPPVEPAKSPYATQLAGAGIVEPESENISIGTNLPGIVERVYVSVGMKVKTGEKLFHLDERQLVAEEKARAANLVGAEATERKLANAPRPEELPPLDAKIAEAKAGMTEQQKLYDRYRKLAASNAISEDEITRREAALETAKALLLKAEADRKLLGAGTWEYDAAIAAATTLTARAQLEQTRTERQRLTMLAPYGRAVRADRMEPDPATTFDVLQVNIRPGEYVGVTSGQALIVLGNLGRLHVRVDIDETDIARFQTGFTGVAKPRGNPNQSFPLKFVRVEPFVIPKRSLTGGNQERVDTRVLQVIYSIDTLGKPMYVGQQMDVFLDTGTK